ncbi:phage tail protein [Gilliamella intestini]|uniref:Phage tail fibre repeat-containing protein n=1 Tax=Gilliamella intestini TaxID=1798183 RepID=A0A1C4BVH5_9GAMM|nr:phage tail protein [Gilliamella intestini]SCC10901.1 Phage tail fibre repeat-containing protein [Gilliamella intestini]
MHRIDTSTAQRDKFGQGKNGFTRGNPQTGTPATQLDYLYCDAIQEEIANAIESAGIKLDKSKHDQLATAIKEFVKKGSVKLNSSTNSTSETEAATPLAVKYAYDLAGQAKWHATNNAVQKTQKINGKQLDTDIALNAYDIGALSKRDFYTQLGNPGFEIMPSGLVRQWGTVQLYPIREFNSEQIGDTKFYTNYYEILLPIAFPHNSDAVNVTLACTTYNNQSSMCGNSVSANLHGSPSKLTIAVTSPHLGFNPVVHFEIIGH